MEDGTMKRVNLTLTDQEYAELLRSYTAFLKRYEADEADKPKKLPPSITGYAAGMLIWTIKESLKGEKD